MEILLALGAWVAGSIWLILPAGIANMTPPAIAQMPLLREMSWPIHEQVFGSHKTWRGLVAGVVSGTAAAWMQQALASSQPFSTISILRYEEYNLLVLGIIFGGGAIAGDMLESTWKRFIGLPPGTPSQLDRVDWLLPVLVILSLMLDMWDMELRAAILIVFAYAAHPVLCRGFHWLGLKEKPY